MFMFHVVLSGTQKITFRSWFSSTLGPGDRTQVSKFGGNAFICRRNNAFSAQETEGFDVLIARALFND